MFGNVGGMVASVLVAACSLCANAGELYVSIDDPAAADDAAEGRGSKALPYWSIQAAVNAASPGDTVWVEPGVYTNGAYRDIAADTKPSACRHKNRVVIDKELTLASTKGRDRTIILGKRLMGNEYGYVGNGTVRCICVEESASNVIIQGFTLKEGAVDNSYPEISTGGGLFARNNATLVDSAIIGCAGYGHGAAVDGATCVRCYIATEDQKDIRIAGSYGALVYGAKLWNCFVLYQHASLGDGHYMLINSDAVNCTFLASKGHLTYKDSRLYNCLSQNCQYENYTEEMLGTVVTENCTLSSAIKSGGGVRMDFLHCANPVLGDYRLMTHSAAVGAGDAKWLVGEAAVVSLPASVEKKDMGGNDVSSLSGTVNAGCTQTVADPAYGGFRVSSSRDLVLNGVKVPGYCYLFATNWPAMWKFDSSVASNILAFAFSNMPDTSVVVQELYPAKGSDFYRMPPKTQKRLLAVSFLMADEHLWIDPESGDDENGDGTAGSPYRTLAHASSVSRCSVTDGKKTIFELRPGVYKEGTGRYSSDPAGVTARFCINPNPNSYFLIRPTDGPGTVTIVGSTNGTDEVRCVRTQSARGCVQGVTLADGFTSSAGYSAYYGGYYAVMINCVVTNCVSSGSLAYCQATASRFVDNTADSYVIYPNKKPPMYCEFLRNRLASGGVVSGANNPRIHNCAFYGNVIDSLPADRSFSGGANNYLNNCVADGNGYFYRRYSADRGPNIVWNVAANSALDPCDISTDPMFADPENGDLRISALSPAVGAGDLVTYHAFMADYEDYASIDIDGRPIEFPEDGKSMLGPRQSAVSCAFVDAPEFGGLALSGVEPGVNAVEDGESLTFSVSPAPVGCPRNCIGVVVTDAAGGVTTNFFADVPGGVWTHTVDSFATSVRVKAYYSPHWYVDAEDGDDANDGFTPATAKKTLAGATTNSVVRSGDIVHAAPGRYDEGTVRESASAVVLNRVVIPSGVTLVADEGRDVTFIVGANAPSPDANGLGTDAVRCVLMRQGARLEGFTVTGGRTHGTEASGTGHDGVAGGVYVGDSSRNMTTTFVVGCDLTNCNAAVAAASRMGVYQRCRFLDNGLSGLFQTDRGTYVSCLFRSVRVCATFGYYCRVYNSLVRGYWDAGTTRGNDYGEYYNTTFIGRHSRYNTFHGCVFATNAHYVASSDSAQNAAASFPDCTFTTVSALELTDDLEPTGVPGVQTDIALPEYSAPAAVSCGKDLLGSPRVMNGAADASPYEWDIRLEAVAVLGRSVSSVDMVSENVLLRDGVLTLSGDGALLEATTKTRGSDFDATLQVAVADGTFTAYVDGVPVASLSQSGELFLGGLRANSRIAFGFEGTGYASFGRLVGKCGVMLIVK